MRHTPSRRRFLQRGLALAALLGNGLPAAVPLARADGFAAVRRPQFANLMLSGGPDMRHLLMPPFSATAGSYGDTFWRRRARSQGIAETLTAMDQRWHEAYLPATSGNTSFGILGRCGWLYEMWNAGKVAFICGVLGNSSRDHDQAQRNLEMGNRTAGKLFFGNGWGGRLALAADCNVVALTTSPRRFTYGPNPAHPLDLLEIDNRRVLPVANTREFALPEAPPDADWYDDYLMRGLEQYYAERRATINKSSVYHQFFEHERKLRELGGSIDGRLATVPIPPAIEALFADGGVGYELALQIRNLYDSLAMHDILNSRIASLEYASSWDTHDNQRVVIEPKLENLFGTRGAFAALYSSLPADARANLSVLVGGEFGRQLRDNGGNGTDHGEGTVMILIGDQVRGGVYGTMFPDEELARIDASGADIRGVNAIDHVFGTVCEWLQPGSKGQVFPYYADAPLEAGLDLAAVFGA